MKTPRFQHLQVEVTTRCDLPGCLMCPRRAWPERWLNHDLSWQIFLRVIPALKLFTQVHLSGWGEPLLHPRLWDMAQAARSQGWTVSLTTNGMNLTDATQLQVLEHLDMVSVSLMGAGLKLMSGCALELILRKSPNRLPLCAPGSGLWEGNARRWSCCS